jgi:uncharacterized protein (TIGR00106 family)
MLAFFSMIPLGTGISFSSKVAESIRVIEESGLDYKMTAMGTILEGDWNEISEVIGKCFEAMHKHSERVSCTIKIDDHAGRDGRLTGKIASVEDKLGHEVKK